MIFYWDKQFEEEVAMVDDEYFEEFMIRLKIKDMHYLGLRGRLTSMTRTVLSYVKSNPHLITPELEDMMRKSERFSWALANFVVKETKIGAEVVAIENTETTGVTNADQNQTNLTVPEVHYQQALLHGAALVKDLLKGIKKSEINLMETKDRIRLGLFGVQMMSKSLNAGKPKNLVFKNLTINSTNKDDLEKAILDYSSNQE